MKVFAKILEGTKIKNVEVDHNLGIEIEHNGNAYILSVDLQDNLILRSIDKVQLVIKPKASNSIEIKSE